MREELLRRASRLVPVLKERAARTEQLRQIPPETVKDLIASGLIRIGNPTRYGGHGVDLDMAHAVAWELGRGCGSSAWCDSLWTVHNWWLGHFPERAQDEFFASGPDTVFSSGLNPARGKAEPGDNGFRVSGRWSFSSGCDAATWAMVAVPGAGPDGLLWLLLPCADYEIVDTWFASGMRGTGSKDIVIKDVFVAAHRALDPNRAGDGDWNGWELHRRPSYRAPLRCLTGWDLAAPLIGMAQGAVDEFASRLRGTSGAGRTAESVAMQMRLAEASAEVDAARTIHEQDIREIIPGVLDSLTNFIEHPELVAQRLVRYAEVVGRERVMAGTDCGFATFARSASRVEPEIAWAKFRAMAEGARLASKQLWR